MRYGSVFSGIGGIDLGFDQAGWECGFQIENDPYCTKVLHNRWPDALRFGDVKDVTCDQLQPGSVDALVGGFPCTDISLAGRRAGLAGERSGLFYEFARLAEELAPTWLLIENVPGLLSSGKRRDMGAVVGTLVELGYCVAWRVLDSQFFGLAQRRKRLFIVGHLGTDRTAAPQVLLERDGSPWDSPPSREAGSGTPRSTGGGVAGHSGGDDDFVPALTAKMAKGTGGPSGDEAQNLVLTRSVALRGRDGSATAELSEDELAFALRASQGGGDKSYVMEVVSSLTRTGVGTCGADDNQAQAGHLIVPDLAATLNSGGNDGGFRTEPGEHLLPVAFAENQRGELRTSDIALQLNTSGGKPGQGYPAMFDPRPIAVHNGDNVCVSEDQALTLTGSKGNPGSITDVGLVRRLTPLECERLQGFPDGWTEGLSDTRKYRALGNAVSVPVAYWIACRMADVHETTETKGVST